MYVVKLCYALRRGVFYPSARDEFGEMPPRAERRTYLPLVKAMGFTAVDGALSAQAISLFGILFLWQMPHFLAIAILYKNDYAAGGFKMLPVIDKDLSVTSRQILLYSLALVPVTLVPVALNMAGAAYFCVATLLGMAFFTFGINVAATKSREDANRLFIASIVYLPVLLSTLMLNKASFFELVN